MNEINTKKFYNDMYLNNPTRWEPHDRPIHPFDSNIVNKIEQLYGMNDCIICDLGCGNGRTLQLLDKPNHFLNGIDFSEEAIKLAKRRVESCWFEVGDMTKTPFVDGAFHIVLSVGSYEHQEVLDFSEPYRLLREDGYFMCVLPNVTESKGLTVAADGEHYDWELTKEDWINKIIPFGFKFIEYLEPWTFVFQK